MKISELINHYHTEYHFEKNPGLKSFHSYP